MAGKRCPKCNQLTFFVNGRNGECKKCGYKMQVPANEGKVQLRNVNRQNEKCLKKFFSSS